MTALVPHVRLLGRDFADFDTRQAASWLANRPAGAPFGYVVTPNADHLVRLGRHREFVELYDNALLCLLDSRVVARAAWSLGLPTPQVTPGSDLTARILRWYRRVHNAIWDWSHDPEPVAQATRTVDTPAQDANIRGVHAP